MRPVTEVRSYLEDTFQVRFQTQYSLQDLLRFHHFVLHLVIPFRAVFRPINRSSRPSDLSIGSLFIVESLAGMLFPPGLGRQLEFITTIHKAPALHALSRPVSS